MQRWSQSTLPTNWPWLLAEREHYETVQAEKLVQTAPAIESNASSSPSAAGSTGCPLGRASPFTGGLRAATRSAGRKENRQSDTHPDITGTIVASERNIWLFWLLSAFFRSILSDNRSI
jgi:hypothetical protein